jgi:hypothetical protein
LKIENINLIDLMEESIRRRRRGFERSEDLVVYHICRPKKEHDKHGRPTVTLLYSSRSAFTFSCFLSVLLLHKV